MTLVLTTVATVLREDMTFVFQVQQRPVVMITAQDDAATLTAVTSAVGIIFHMLQVHRSPTALTRPAQDLHIVYKITLHTDISNNGLHGLHGLRQNNNPSNPFNPLSLKLNLVKY